MMASYHLLGPERVIDFQHDGKPLSCLHTASKEDGLLFPQQARENLEPLLYKVHIGKDGGLSPLYVDKARGPLPH